MKAGDEHAYKFRIGAKQSVTLAVTARHAGSPLDALLTLKTAGGQVIEQSNGSGDAEAKISRALEPGEYVASIRDLTYAGGPSYAYRLSVATSASTATPDFTVRVMPDAVRVARGGSAKLWCEVRRANGFRGPVTIALAGLPAGVAALGPVVIDETTSGIFTISAAADAAMTTTPLQIRAVAASAGIVREAEAELNNRLVSQAYVTVIEAAPFTVDAVAALRPEQLKEYPKQVAEVSARLAAAGAKLETAQAAWEKQLAGQLGDQGTWKALSIEKLSSANGAALAKDASDDSIVVSGSDPERETYTITATTELKGITAIRLEAIADPHLPSNGPGRAPNGNFVVNRFTVTAAPKTDPSKAEAVKFKGATATFEQQNYAASSAVGVGGGGGWAIVPQTGATQAAVFSAAMPFGAEGGTVLTFTIDQQFGGQHTLGRFRLSVTTDSKAATPSAAPSVPSAIVALVRTPAEERTAEQKAKVAEYYRSIAPELAADRSRLESLRQGVGAYAEIERLEEMLSGGSPQLDAERTAWEKTALSGGWTVADAASAKSANAGTTLAKQPDGSLLAAGDNPATNTYTVTANTALKQITAVRLEALPDERLPANGPGRAANGNFALGELKLQVKAKDKGEARAIEFAAARADFEQAEMPVAAAIDGKGETGWGVLPETGRPVSATFFPKSPIDLSGASLIFTLEQQSPHAQHTLGRFRLWVTESPHPLAAAAVPPEVVAILKVAADKRSEEQKAALANYYRAISPTLAAARVRVAELRAAAQPLPLSVARNKAFTIPVPIARAAGFSGDVTVTLEGFVAGRDPQTRQPMAIAKSLNVTPLVMKGAESFGKLTVRANGNSEVGTRMVVLRAETKVGNDTWVQYSPAFALTVTEK
jgi:hypothetical protein